MVSWCFCIDLWFEAALLPLLCDIIFLFISHSCICGFMWCTLIQQMEEIMYHVRELSGAEFGTNRSIHAASIKSGGGEITDEECLLGRDERTLLTQAFKGVLRDFYLPLSLCSSVCTSGLVGLTECQIEGSPTMPMGLRKAEKLAGELIFHQQKRRSF